MESVRESGNGWLAKALATGRLSVGIGVGTCDGFCEGSCYGSDVLDFFGKGYC